MIESPLLKEVEKRARLQVTRESILQVLSARFGPVAEELSATVSSIKGERKLRALLTQAALCADLAAFRAAMRS
jgi:hypothetical protein